MNQTYYLVLAFSIMEKLKYFAKHILSQIPIVLVILDLHFDGKLNCETLLFTGMQLNLNCVDNFMTYYLLCRNTNTI